jgi:peptidoglycan/xylan/chitin deacetylase (PgdA/CDA1 family)
VSSTMSMKQHDLDCGVFTVSLDFELYWGLRDHVSLDGYRRNLLGARTAVQRLLDLFREYEIHATWAVVGFLLFERREELLQALPSQLPRYKNETLSPYNHIAKVGTREADDPLHFAPSLVRAIAATPHQEIGTHTFSHYYCLEEGQDVESFKADLQAAIAASERFGVRPRSLVFPRNQFSPEYLAACRSLGIEACRTNQGFWAYYAVPQRGNNLIRRTLRFLDSYFSVAPHTVYSPKEIGSDFPRLIPASRFLRPYSHRLRALEPLRFRRIAAELSEAAMTKKIYHLWWHPHNFGVHAEENFAFLRRILEHYRGLSDRHEMVTLNMGEIAAGVAEPAGGVPC